MIDADSLLLLARRLGPPSRSPAVWKQLSQLARDGRLRTPEQINKEVSKQSEELAGWLADHPDISVQTSDLWERARNVTTRFPDVAGVEPGTPGDPWLIALALKIKDAHQQTTAFDPVDEPWVITQEQPRRNAQRVTRIAEACGELGIECDDVWGMLELEGLEVALVKKPT